jgi:hypothetical protein
MSLGLVAVPAAPAWPPPPGARQLERSRADGPRLCLHGAAALWPLAARVRALVEGRSGGNGRPKAGAGSPRHPWISAKAWMALPPCVARSVGSRRWRGPSPCSAPVRARRSRCGSTMGRAPGAACKDGRTVTAAGGPRPPTHGGPCPRGSCCLGGGTAIPRAPRGPATGAGWPQAQPGGGPRPRAATPPGPHRPRAGARAAPPETPPR